MKLSIKDLVTFTEEILNGKLHFLCSVRTTVVFEPDEVYNTYVNTDENLQLNINIITLFF